MKKTKVGVIFGGMSAENEVSVVSGDSILKNINREKYDVFPIYIDKKGEWYKYDENIETLEIEEKTEKIEEIIVYLKQLDVLFPILHGEYGEDGCVQGLFELLKIPYVGSKILASSIGMDKIYSKIIFEKAGLKQAKYEYIRKYGDKYIYIDKEFNETILEIGEILKIITKNLKFPMFVKPSNSGSSVGINKSKNIEQLKEHIDIASQIDSKIAIEEEIKGREVECAVLGNEDVITSCIGEVKPAEEFYTYDAKYNNIGSETIIPADIPKEISDEIKSNAIKAYKSIDAKGLSRVDFFIEEGTNSIIINEINTLPGFTSISMYPKLFIASGISYKELIDRLICLALQKS